jgi:hypothetical protein
VRIKSVLFLILVAILFYYTPGVRAEVKVFVMSRAETDGTLTVGDIASVDGEPAAAARIKSIAVKPELYADGYLDRVELETLLSSGFPDPVSLYGGGVRVTMAAPAVESEKKEVDPGTAEDRDVCPGDAVDVFVRKNGIVLQTRGRAVEGGKKGDRIHVRVKGTRSLKGTIIDKKCILLAVQ